MKTGIVYLTVKMYLNQDIEITDIPDLIDSLDLEMIWDEKKRVQEAQIIAGSSEKPSDSKE